jgi:tartrate dehydratase beta subunit/fumarate hydratase class I family protein
MHPKRTLAVLAATTGVAVVLGLLIPSVTGVRQWSELGMDAVCVCVVVLEMLRVED